MDNDAGTNQANEGQTSGSQAQAQTSQSGSAGRTFTQAELDQIIQERIGRERQKYADYEDLKKAAVKLKELETSQMSEAERLRAKLSELERSQADWQRERQELVLKHALAAAAAKAGALYPEAVYKLVDLASLEFEPDGSPKALDATVAALRKQYPMLFRSGSGSADGGTGGRSAGGLDMNNWIRRAAGRT